MALLQATAFHDRFYPRCSTSAKPLHAGAHHHHQLDVRYLDLAEIDRRNSRRAMSANGFVATLCPICPIFACIPAYPVMRS